MKSLLKNISEKTYGNSGNPDVLAQLTVPGKVLDVGCGVGDNARILQGNGFVVDGITISSKELAQAEPYLSQGWLFDLEQGLPSDVKPNHYDYIICSHVLEHICYPERLLLAIRNCLKPGGKLVVALPNIFHYSSRWQLFKGNFNYQDAGLWDNTHFKWYSYQTGRQLLEKYGFKVTLQTVTGSLPAYSLFSKILSPKVSDVFFKQLIKISPGFFGYQLLYVAEAENN